jgi:hypothetical protein
MQYHRSEEGRRSPVFYRSKDVTSSGNIFKGWVIGSLLVGFLIIGIVAYVWGVALDMPQIVQVVKNF